MYTLYRDSEDSFWTLQTLRRNEYTPHPSVSNININICYHNTFATLVFFIVSHFLVLLSAKVLSEEGFTFLKSNTLIQLSQ